MAGLISPKPVSYMQHANLQYNPYQRNVSSYSDSANPVPPLGMHTPNQALAAFSAGSPAATLSAHEEQKIYGLVIDLLDPGLLEFVSFNVGPKDDIFEKKSSAESLCSERSFMGIPCY